LAAVEMGFMHCHSRTASLQRREPYKSYAFMGKNAEIQKKQKMLKFRFFVIARLFVAIFTVGEFEDDISRLMSYAKAYGFNS
jgi:hypothetical protein